MNESQLSAGQDLWSLGSKLRLCPHRDDVTSTSVNGMCVLLVVCQEQSHGSWKEKKKTEKSQITIIKKTWVKMGALNTWKCQWCCSRDQKEACNNTRVCVSVTAHLLQYTQTSGWCAKTFLNHTSLSCYMRSVNHLIYKTNKTFILWPSHHAIYSNIVLTSSAVHGGEARQRYLNCSPVFQTWVFGFTNKTLWM